MYFRKKTHYLLEWYALLQLNTIWNHVIVLCACGRFAVILISIYSTKDTCIAPLEMLKNLAKKLLLMQFIKQWVDDSCIQKNCFMYKIPSLVSINPRVIVMTSNFSHLRRYEFA